MTDKVQKIRAFLVGIADADGVSTILAKAIEKKILPYIDSLQEESVSEDLEEDLEKEFSRVWDKELSGQCDTLVALNVARHFANWQKQKDEHEIWQLSHANYEKGKSNMKKQMVREICDWLREYCVPILSDCCVSDLVEDLQRKFGEDAEAGV